MLLSIASAFKSNLARAAVVFLEMGAILLVPSPSFGNEKPKISVTQTVIAEGVGRTADEALKDAFRGAVRQVVGALIDAETLVKDDEIVSDKVLTFSNGFVKKYEEISKKEDNGLIRVKIKAVVERKGVVEKLKEANVKIKEVDGKGLFAEAMTDLEREKDAAAILKKAFEGFPMNCMTASVVGDPKIVEKDGDQVTISVTVQVEPNLVAYKAFAKNLDDVLSKIVLDKNDKGDFMVESKLRNKENGVLDQYEGYKAKRKDGPNYELDNLCKEKMQKFYRKKDKYTNNCLFPLEKKSLFQFVILSQKTMKESNTAIIF